MALIREWVVTIVSAIIFATFIEILIPNSNYKRYINVVVGFLLMIVILTPLTKLIDGQINFEEEILSTYNQLELSTTQNRISNIQHNNNDVIIALYKSEINKQIKSYVENTTNYKVDEVLVEVEDNNDSKEFGSIKKLNIALEKKAENVEAISKVIKPIEVNISSNEKNNNTKESKSILINNEGNLIKNNISSLYNISEDDINVYILKNN